MAAADPAPLHVDFNGMHMNFVIDDGTTQEQINNPAFLASRIETIPAMNARIAQVAVTEVGEPIYSFIPHDDEIPSFIEFADGFKAYIVADLGGGSYGMTAYVRSEDGTTYCLKRQKLFIENNALYLSALREAMIHYILYSKTRSADGSSTYVPVIHRVAIHDDYIYFLMEKMVHTCGTFIHSLAYIQRAPQLAAILLDIGEKLRYLYERFGYNHGDLHAGNVMMAADGSFRLIDFGFSRMQLSDALGELSTNPGAARTSSSRDLTHFAKVIFVRQFLYDTDDYTRRFGAYLEYCLYAFCDRPGHDQCHFTNLYAMPWGYNNMWQYENEHNNVRCVHQTFLEGLARINNGAPAPPPASVYAPPPPPYDPVAAAAAAAAAVAEERRRNAQEMRRYHQEQIERRRRRLADERRVMGIYALGLLVSFVSIGAMFYFFNSEQQGGRTRRRHRKIRTPKQNVRRRRRTIKRRKL